MKFFVALVLALVGAASAGFIAPAISPYAYGAPVVSTYAAGAPVISAYSGAPLVNTYSAAGPIAPVLRSAYYPNIAAPTLVRSAYASPFLPAVASAPVVVDAWKKKAAA